MWNSDHTTDDGGNPVIPTDGPTVGPTDGPQVNSKCNFFFFYVLSVTFGPADILSFIAILAALPAWLMSVGCIAIEFCSDILGTQMKNPTHFVSSAPSRSKFWFTFVVLN